MFFERYTSSFFFRALNKKKEWNIKFWTSVTIFFQDTPKIDNYFCWFFFLLFHRANPELCVSRPRRFVDYNKIAKHVCVLSTFYGIHFPSRFDRLNIVQQTVTAYNYNLFVFVFHWNTFSHHNLLDGLRLLFPSDYRNYLYHSTFSNLLKMITPMIEKQDTYMRKPISSVQRLSCTLQYLATGVNFEELMFITAITLHKSLEKTLLKHVKL